MTSKMELISHREIEDDGADGDAAVQPAEEEDGEAGLLSGAAARRGAAPLANDVTPEELAARPMQPKNVRKDSTQKQYTAIAGKWWPKFRGRGRIPASSVGGLCVPPTPHRYHYGGAAHGARAGELYGGQPALDRGGSRLVARRRTATAAAARCRAGCASAAEQGVARRCARGSGAPGGAGCIVHVRLRRGYVPCNLACVEVVRARPCWPAAAERSQRLDVIRQLAIASQRLFVRAVCTVLCIEFLCIEYILHICAFSLVYRERDVKKQQRKCWTPSSLRSMPVGPPLDLI